jgi:GNAT superfamily N-acetyltransferase
MAAAALSFREAGRGDEGLMAATTHEGFEVYRAFAPPGWEPPTMQAERERVEERMAWPGMWALIAFDGDRPAGHVGLLTDAEPGTAYLWQLFVRRPYWGTGLAITLHGAWRAAARERGHERGRLLTPAGQARARRFYERSGWHADGPPAHDDEIGFEIVEYRRADLY